MSIYSQQLDTSHNEYAQTLRSLATLYRATGRVEMARPLLLEEKRVQGMAEKIGLARGQR